METFQGGCHCGRVQFEVQLEMPVTIQACNCSLCAMTAFLHIIVPASRFELVKGQDDLSVYTFNTGVAQHLFCQHCGVKSFYVPRSNPDGFSVNARCIKGFSLSSAKIEVFDGQNWEQNAESLSHLSQV